MASKLKAKSPELIKPEKPKIIVFGTWGVGKTWGVIDFPKCFLIDCEGGAKQPHYVKRLIDSGAGVFGVEDGALDPVEVLGQLKALATEEHPYETVVIDSISKLFKTIASDKADELGDQDVYGASNKPAVSAMKKIVRLIDKMDMNVVMTAYEKDFYGMIGGKRDVVDIAPDIHKDINHDLNLVLRIEKQGPRRTMRATKSRYENLPEGKVFEWSYQKLAELIGKDVIERKSTKLELADEETVSEIRRVVDLLKVDPSDIAKWHTKAKADDFSEYSKDQAAKTLEFLNSKLRGAA